jgi:hypothetical protein
MKRVILCFMIAVSCVVNAYALDFKIVNMRGQIFDQSAQIKEMVTPKTRDGVLLTVMFDSCMLAVTQLDAYLSMLGIFETLSGPKGGEDAIKFIIAWLNSIKDSNNLSIQNMDSLMKSEAKTKEQVKKLRAMFVSFNGIVDEELRKLNALKISIRRQAK